jgi:hypothetical protein
MNKQLEAVFQQFGLTVLQFVALQLVLEGHANLPSDVSKTLGLDTAAERASSISLRRGGCSSGGARPKTGGSSLSS